MLGKKIGGVIKTYSKAKCLKVKLFSEANTGYFYTWKKNPKAYPWRIAMRKYDPIVRKHVLFKERKGGFMTWVGL